MSTVHQWEFLNLLNFNHLSLIRMLIGDLGQTILTLGATLSRQDV